jgi:hypothetical protein
MTAEEHRELFTAAIYEWLEANGVRFEPITAGPPFMARLDLNVLKVGMVALIEAFGGHFELVDWPASAGELLALLLAVLPPGAWAGMERERGYVFTVAELPGGRRYRITVEETE